MAKKLIAGYVGIGGTARKVKNVKTGEIMTRRAYAQKVKHPGLSNEELAKLNKLQNPEAQILRPARGRSSALKEGKETRHTIAQARLEHQKNLIKKSNREKAATKRDKKIAALLDKQLVIPKKVTKRLLKPGKMGRTISFNDYSELLTILKDARKTGVIIGYALGIEGVDLNTEPPKTMGFFVFKLIEINETINEDRFTNRMAEEIQSRKSYFLALRFMVHLAFSRKFYEQTAKNDKSKSKTKPKAKSKNNPKKKVQRKRSQTK